MGLGIKVSAGAYSFLHVHMFTLSLHTMLRQVTSPRTRRRAIHTGIFAGIQTFLQLCSVPSLLALMLAFAVVKLVASRQPDVHSSSCRTATAIATLLGAGVAGNFSGALLCFMLVVIAPKEFLWWPLQHSDDAPSPLEVSDAEPCDIAMIARSAIFGAQFKLEEPLP